MTQNYWTRYPSYGYENGEPGEPAWSEEDEAQYQKEYHAEQDAQEYATAYAMQYGITDPVLIEAIHDDHFRYLMDDHSAAPRTA